MGLKLKHGTAAAATAANETLEVGELGYETDTGKWKVGNGSTAWNSLPYLNIGTGSFQPLDSDLTTIAGLTATTGNMILSAGSAWTSATPSAVKTALAIAVADVSGAAPLASPTFTGTVTLPTGLSGIAKLTSGVVSAVTAPSGTIVGTTDTQTLSAKRITPRVVTISSSATPALNTDTADVGNCLALATNVTSMTTSLTGTPTDGDRLMLRFKDNGTARTITWGASFQSSGVATLLATTVISKTHHVGLMYDGAASKWTCLAVDATGY